MEERRHTHGTVSKPLGRERLSAVELVQVIINLPKGDSELEMISGPENNILQFLLKMLPQYPWNNFLQLRVKDIFESLLKGNKLSKD